MYLYLYYLHYKSWSSLIKMSGHHFILRLQAGRHQAGQILAVPGQALSDRAVRQEELRIFCLAETVWSRALQLGQGLAILGGQLGHSLR